MDVFSLRNNVIGDYGTYVRSFLTIKDERIRRLVQEETDGDFLWPDPLIQLNPSFEVGETLQELIDNGELHPECMHIFRDKREDGTVGAPFRLHRHQIDGIRAALAGDSYVLTTGTSSGKSLSEIVPIVDEVQDLKPPELRFLETLCAKRPGNFMVCGDAGQRIYPSGFSLSALGIEVRGRSTVLRINYRTTEQIRRVADRMLGRACDDMDGDEEQRTGTRSLLRGPTPRLAGHASPKDEIAAGVAEIRRWLGEGLAPEAIGVFARTGKRTNELSEALQVTDIPWRRLSDKETVGTGAVQLGTRCTAPRVSSSSQSWCWVAATRRSRARVRSAAWTIRRIARTPRRGNAAFCTSP